MQSFQDIRYSTAGPVATITLARPEKLNAARIATHAELIAAFDLAEADDDVRAVIVTGEGRAFCAGTDLSGGFELPRGGDPRTGEGVQADVGGRVTLRLFAMRKPVIGAINGAAVGFGATFPLAMDYRLAAEGARFCYIFARRGIMAESCSSYFLPRLVGLPTALDWMMTGRFIDAAEALSKGLVQAVVAPEALMERAMAHALSIAENTSPASVALNRQLLWRMADARHPIEAHLLESRALAAMLEHPDSREGAAAFGEKRPPRFTGTVGDTDFMDDWWKD